MNTSRAEHRTAVLPWQEVKDWRHTMDGKAPKATVIVRDANGQPVMNEHGKPKRTWKHRDAMLSFDDVKNDSLNIGIPMNGNRVTLDFDHVLTKPRDGYSIIPEAKERITEILARYPRPYMEYSKSGLGMHFCYECLKPLPDFYQKGKGGTPEPRIVFKSHKDASGKVIEDAFMEIFSRASGKFVALTGDIIDRSTAKVVADCSNGIGDATGKSLLEYLAPSTKTYADFERRHGLHAVDGDKELDWNTTIPGEDEPPAKQGSDDIAADFEKWDSERYNETLKDHVLDMLERIPADCSYNEWLTVGHALYNAGFSFDYFDSWSQSGAKYASNTGSNTTRYKWDDFAKNPEPFNMKHIYSIARRYDSTFYVHDVPTVPPYMDATAAPSSDAAVRDTMDEHTDAPTPPASTAILASSTSPDAGQAAQEKGTMLNAAKLLGTKPVYLIVAESKERGKRLFDELLLDSEATAVVACLNEAGLKQVFDTIDAARKKNAQHTTILIVYDDTEQADAHRRDIIEPRAKLAGINLIDGAGLLYGDPPQVDAGVLDDMEDKTAEAEREQAQAYRAKHSATSTMDCIMADIESSSIFAKTGFDGLDAALGGGLFADRLYFLGGITGTGKTTFCLQVAENIARAGTDVLYFSLEMLPKELWSRTISRLTYHYKYLGNTCLDGHKTALQVMTGSFYKKYSDLERRVIADCREQFRQEIGDHLFYIYELGKIDLAYIAHAVAEHTRWTKKRPVVVLDYLQIMKGMDDKEHDTRRIVNANVEGLKGIATRFHVPVIGVSAFNRNSYSEAVNTASFRETSAIEYTADALLGIQYAGMDDSDLAGDLIDELDRKKEQDGERAVLPMQLKILKCRTSHFGNVYFKYSPAYNDFQESDEIRERVEQHHADKQAEKKERAKERRERKGQRELLKGRRDQITDPNADITANVNMKDVEKLEQTSKLLESLGASKLTTVLVNFHLRDTRDFRSMNVLGARNLYLAMRQELDGDTEQSLDDPPASTSTLAKIRPLQEEFARVSIDNARVLGYWLTAHHAEKGLDGLTESEAQQLLKLVSNGGIPS